jgi:Virulence factor BrkB
MSTASAVPETFELEGDDARETLKHVGWTRLLKDSFTRLRTADGFSHVRALAHATVLTAFPALITIIGVATLFDLATFRNVLEHTLQQLAPGPSGRLLSTAFQQGSKSGGSAALVGGLLASVVSGTFALAQVERGCNRIYGMVRDRSLIAKLRVGLALLVSGRHGFRCPSVAGRSPSNVRRVNARVQDFAEPAAAWSSLVADGDDYGDSLLVRSDRSPRHLLRHERQYGTNLWAPDWDHRVANVGVRNCLRSLLRDRVRSTTRSVAGRRAGAAHAAALQRDGERSKRNSDRRRGLTDDPSTAAANAR